MVEILAGLVWGEGIASPRMSRTRDGEDQLFSSRSRYTCDAVAGRRWPE
jgi:hypothetical protein